MSTTEENEGTNVRKNSLSKLLNNRPLPIGVAILYPAELEKALTRIHRARHVETKGIIGASINYDSVGFGVSMAVLFWIFLIILPKGGFYYTGNIENDAFNFLVPILLPLLTFMLCVDSFNRRRIVIIESDRIHWRKNGWPLSGWRTLKTNQIDAVRLHRFWNCRLFPYTVDVVTKECNICLASKKGRRFSARTSWLAELIRDAAGVPLTGNLAENANSINNGARFHH